MSAYNKKKKKITLFFFQVSILIIFLLIWDILARYKIINTFLFSSPTNIYKTIISLVNNDLFKHVGITTFEVLVGFTLTSVLGILVAVIFWWCPTIYKIFDPYVTVLNSLPKVALGPLIIIWFGSGIKSIIFMTITISVFSTIINVYHGFSSVQRNLIVMIKSFGASKIQIFNKVVLPSNLLVIMTTIKINISLCLVGVIMGELLVSKEGLGYLIMYGSQIFNLDLVITSIFLLGILSFVFYYILEFIIKFINKRDFFG